MARGKSVGVSSLKDSVKDSEIVRLGEIRNEPNYILDDDYGISGGYADYSLVKKRVAYRTGTIVDGINCDKVIEYISYDDAPCYMPTITGIMESYARILNLSEFKTKKIMSSLGDLYAIQKNTASSISKALKGFDTPLNKTQNEVCELMDTKASLIEEIRLMKESMADFKKAKKDVDGYVEVIKEKYIYVMEKDKVKQHRVKLED